MEPGTRFCPYHPGIKAQPYRDECPICNRSLVTRGHTYPDGAEIGPHFQADDVKPLEPNEETIIMKRLAELDDPEPPKITFMELHEKVSAKIKAKKAIRKGKE